MIRFCDTEKRPKRNNAWKKRSVVYRVESWVARVRVRVRSSGLSGRKRQTTKYTSMCWSLYSAVLQRRLWWNCRHRESSLRIALILCIAIPWHTRASVIIARRLFLQISLIVNRTTRYSTPDLSTDRSGFLVVSIATKTSWRRQCDVRESDDVTHLPSIVALNCYYYYYYRCIQHLRTTSVSGFNAFSTSAQHFTARTWEAVSLDMAGRRTQSLINTTQPNATLTLTQALTLTLNLTLFQPQILTS